MTDHPQDKNDIGLIHIPSGNMQGGDDKQLR